ncbi:MAG: prepilin-type N-terminal cleavage/methylation domain-containing protein [Acidobacteria bacterium]|nr:prepilin-type N-terminal cleavage/methylation domain-containing protein [Acidobacteriota bacterium]
MMTGTSKNLPRPRADRGFSLLELLVVVAILLTMMAVATPSLLRAINSYRLESSARGVSTLIQRTRFEAMRRNRTTCTGFVDLGGEGRYIMDVTGKTPAPCFESPPTLDPNEPAVGTPANVMWYLKSAPQLPPSFKGLPAGYDGTTMVVPTDYRVIFSPRGTAMVDDGVGNLIIATRIQAICLLGRRDSDLPNVDDAVLITVTPVGNVKLFKWNRGTEFWMPL